MILGTPDKPVEIKTAQDVRILEKNIAKCFLETEKLKAENVEAENEV